MTPRQLERMMIRRNNKLTWTKGERDFQAFLDSRALEWEHDITLPFSFEGKMFDFQLDFYRRTASGSIDLDIEIDGKGHKEKWDRWKDEIKNAQGVTVFHIREATCKRRYWSDLDRLLTYALQSKDATVYLPE